MPSIRELAVDVAAVRRAAEAIAHADVVVVTAGAGMGVDAGLPDFRGDEGFWRAYPPYERLGLRFVELASPASFHRDLALAWGFYGHRRELYRRTTPHEGYRVARELLEGAPTAGLVFTSNVDGHFARAGVDEDRVTECHGSLLWDQCLAGCGQPPWEADPAEVEVDPATMRAVGDVPRCPACDGVARPNVLMFGDAGFEPGRVDAQERRLAADLEAVAGEEVVVLEAGAGTAVPTVRWFGEQLARSHGATLVRINPREPEGGHIALRSGAAAALTAVAAALDQV
jgi:NAD-dependent SIR2 family protein deacetylase